MKLFRTKVWKWRDAWLLKWSAFLFGIAVGAYLHSYLEGFLWVLFVVAVLLAISPTIAYFRD